jgi:hypothetical protein
MGFNQMKFLGRKCSNKYKLVGINKIENKKNIIPQMRRKIEEILCEM